MPFGVKKCLFCGKELECKIKRDLWRKKFCSYACRQRYNYKNGKIDIRKLWAKCNTPEVNKKKCNKGEKNGRYLKDRSLIKNKRYYNSPEGKLWRLSIYERDGFTCQKCNQKGGKLVAHHIKSYRNYPNLRMDVNNGITLCIKCHKEIHKTMKPILNPEQ